MFLSVADEQAAVHFSALLRCPNQEGVHVHFKYGKTVAASFVVR